MKTVNINGKEITIHGDLALSVGNGNRHYFFCDYHEQRRNYGVCLCLINAKATQERDPDESERTCWKAMDNGECDALRMRELETLLDGSIFYTARMGTPDRPFIDGSLLGAVQERAYSKESYERGWAMVGGALNRPEKPVTAEAAVEVPARVVGRPTLTVVPKGPEQPTLADAINKQMGELYGEE